MEKNNNEKQQISVQRCIGKGYNRGWFTNCKCRYRIFKGARSTKKSYVMIGYEVLFKILSCPQRNILIIRNTIDANRYSTFTTLCRLINQPLDDFPSVSFAPYFKINQTSMTIKYKPTGQLILFAGMQDPAKITSTRTPVGYLTDVYIEEAFELEDYDAWRKVDGTIRGKLPPGLFFQITFCLNAWNKNHWLYERFFKDRFEDDLDYLLTHDYMDYIDENFIGDYGKGLYMHISTYKVNEFRADYYDEIMEEMRKKVPEIYKVEALGMWGNASGATYPEFNDECIKPRQFINNLEYSCYSIGIDTGLSDGEGKVKKGENVRIRSATTMQLVGITRDYNKLIAIDEFFYTNENQLIKKTEPQLMYEIVDTIIEWKERYIQNPILMKGQIYVYVDCADIGFRQGLELVAREKGLFNATFIGSTKMRIQTRVDFSRLIMGMGDYLVSEACANLIREFRNSHKGEKGEAREDIDDHAINANEYAWASIIKKLRRWKDFKEH